MEDALRHNNHFGDELNNAPGNFSLPLLFNVRLFNDPTRPDGRKFIIVAKRMIAREKTRLF